MDSILKMISIINAVGCLTPTIVNLSKEPWDAHDTAVYSSAMERCKVHFGKDAPCLKKFIKKGDNHYYAVCGGSSKQVSSAPSWNDYWFSIVVNKKSEQKDFPVRGTAPAGKTCKGACSFRKGFGERRK